ncbi:hypothetical protein [Flavobacterium pedocola]
MKHTFSILAAFLFLISCQKNEPKTDNLAQQKSNTAEDLHKEIKSIINGEWYETGYIEDLKKTKSPFQSQNALAWMVQLDIDTAQITGDSLEVSAPGIHEGYGFKILFKQGLTKNSVKTNIINYDSETDFFELGYDISNRDTTLIINRYNKNKKLLKQVKYKKAPKGADDVLKYMVNKTLFSGTYETIENSGQKMTLTFSDNGAVTGFENHKKYEVITDFVAGPENYPDLICFNNQTDKQSCYTYRINGTTIKLFDIKETEDGEYSTEPGELRYELIKQ